MARGKTSQDERKNAPPAITVEAREEQLIALATNLAEKQLREGTARSQVIVHYLKLGSTKERLEKELLAKQVELSSAKTEALKSAKKIEELYSKAMEAFSRYRGDNDGEDHPDLY